MFWIDTHCHLDAFADEAVFIRAQAAKAQVGLCVLPAVEVNNFDVVRKLAHQTGDGYALGIHPLNVPNASDTDLHALESALHSHQNDPHLLAVGEIGLDFFVPSLCTPDMRAKQLHFYTTQLKLAQQFNLPVLLHVRKSADQLLKPLRQLHQQSTPITGIAHAFNGSLQQAEQFITLGFKLGFGGASTYDRANNLHKLLRQLPHSGIVLETDAPDMPPHWLYTPKAERDRGATTTKNTPVELPKIAQYIAIHMGIDTNALQSIGYQNSLAALPKAHHLLNRLLESGQSNPKPRTQTNKTQE